MSDDSRRRFLAGLGGLALSALAGCTGPFGDRGSSPRIGAGDQRQGGAVDPPMYTPPDPGPLPDPDVERTLRARSVTASPGPSETTAVWGYADDHVGRSSASRRATSSR